MDSLNKGLPCPTPLRPACGHPRNDLMTVSEVAAHRAGNLQESPTPHAPEFDTEFEQKDDDIEFLQERISQLEIRARSGDSLKPDKSRDAKWMGTRQARISSGNPWAIYTK
jgi:hypothetical protein